jgi:hypothetical protein
MATHSPLLMAYPGAQLLRLSQYGLGPVTLQETDHDRLLREFCINPSHLHRLDDERLSIRHHLQTLKMARLPKIVFSGFQGAR